MHPVTWREIITIIFTSIAITLAIILLNHDPINVDGILYLDVSHIYRQFGWQAAMAVYPWPFYSCLITWLYSALHTPPLLTALWLNTFFITIAIIALNAILAQQQIATKIRWGAVLLLLTWPELNHLRHYIIRDAGYWACLFGGFYFFLCYWQTPTWRYALAWGTLLICAILFRIEGSVIWCILPVVIFLRKDIHWRQRWQQWLKINTCLGISLLLLITWKIFHPHPHADHQLGRLNDLWQYAQNLSLVAQHLWSWKLWVDFIIGLANTLSPLYVLGIIYALIYRLLPRNPDYLPIIGFIILNFLIPLLFYAYSYILAQRYVMPLAFMLCILPAFALKHLLQQYLPPKNTPTHPAKYLLILLIFCGWSIQTASGIVPFGYSKAYLPEAGKWLQQHVSPQASIYSNSREVLFYAGRSTLEWQNNPSPDTILTSLKTDGWKNYNYLAIRINQNDDNSVQQWVNRLPLQPIKIFANNRHDKVMVFYVSH